MSIDKSLERPNCECIEKNSSQIITVFARVNSRAVALVQHRLLDIVSPGHQPRNIGTPRAAPGRGFQIYDAKGQRIPNSIHVSHFERSRAFYLRALAAMGHVSRKTLATGMGFDVGAPDDAGDPGGEFWTPAATTSKRCATRPKRDRNRPAVDPQRDR